jgi:hypothetical protein
MSTTVNWGLWDKSCLSILVFSALLNVGFGAVAQAENRLLTNTIDKTRTKKRLQQRFNVFESFIMGLHVCLYKKSKPRGTIIDENIT